MGKATADAVILGTIAPTFPLVVSAAATANVFGPIQGPQYRWVVAAATYTTLTTFLAALNAATRKVGSTPQLNLASFVHFTATTTKVKATLLDPAGAGANTQQLVGTVMTQAKLAGVNASGGITGPVRLWQTSIGYAPTPAIDRATGIFYPGSANDPLPITIENQSVTNAVFIAQGSGATAVTKTTGLELPKGGSITFSNIGWDQVWAIATTTAVTVAVMVGR